MNAISLSGKHGSASVVTNFSAFTAIDANLHWQCALVTQLYRSWAATWLGAMSGWVRSVQAACHPSIAQ